MTIDVDKLHEVSDGLSIYDRSSGTSIDGPVYTGGPNSPVGLNFPERTFYLQNTASGVLIWRKFGNGVNDWRILSAQDIPFDPANVDLVSADMQGASEELANRHFGKDQGFVQDLGTFITTSTTFVTVLDKNFTANADPDGTYRFGWSSEIITSKSNTAAEIRIVIDAGLPGEIVIDEGIGVSISNDFSGFDSGVITNGPHNVALQTRRTAGNGSISVSRSRIEEWRVS